MSKGFFFCTEACIVLWPPHEEPDVPLSSSGASAVSESLWLSARPVQISCCRTASAMGITMAVVDVLLSHMDRNTVQHMKPSTNLDKREVNWLMWVCVFIFLFNKCKLQILCVRTFWTDLTLSFGFSVFILCVWKGPFNWICESGCVCRSHARLGPRNHHHAQGDAFVQVPLLYGGCQADDSHQQQSGVLTILCCHLNTHTQKFL